MQKGKITTSTRTRKRPSSPKSPQEPMTKLLQDNARLREKLEEVQRDHRWNYEDAMRAKKVQQNMVKMLRNIAEMIDGTIPRYFFQPDGDPLRPTDDVPF